MSFKETIIIKRQSTEREKISASYPTTIPSRIYKELRK
jgi:hypothetical protein